MNKVRLLAWTLILAMLATACPVGTNVAVYAHLHRKNYPYAVETAVVSTLFSIITIPAVVWLSGLIW